MRLDSVTTAVPPVRVSKQSESKNNLTNVSDLDDYNRGLVHYVSERLEEFVMAMGRVEVVCCRIVISFN